MIASPACLDLLKEFEGYGKLLPDGRCTAYQERLNGGKLDIPTIGWGCTEGVTMGMVWTREEAEEGLRRELAKHEALVASLVTVPLTQHQFDALVSFSYNVGKLAQSTLLKKLNAGEFAAAASEFAAWTKAGGHEQPGLVRRRAAERALFLKPDAPEHMPQSAEEAAAKPLAKSQTISGSIGAGIAGVGLYLEQTFQVGVQSIAAMNDLAPIRDTLAQIGANGKSLMLGFLTFCVALVISRRVKAKQEGKAG